MVCGNSEEAAMTVVLDKMVKAHMEQKRTDKDNYDFLAVLFVISLIMNFILLAMVVSSGVFLG